MLKYLTSKNMIEGKVNVILQYSCVVNTVAFLCLFVCASSIPMCFWLCVHAHVCVRMCACACACARAHVRVHMCACTCARAHAHVCMRRRMCAC